MKIKLTRSVVVFGHPNAQVGDCLEVNPGIAGELFGVSAAVPVHEIEVREPVIEHRDPVIAETPQQKSLRRRPAK